MDQPFKHIHTSAASPPSPPQLFEVEFRNLPNTHKRVYHANFVAQRDLFVEGEMKKLAKDGKSKVVD